MTNLNDELRTFITESIMYGHVGEPLTDDTSFLDAGVIDSTGVLELITYVEGRFGFTMADEDMVPENLDSINGLIRYIPAQDEPGRGVQMGDLLPELRKRLEQSWVALPDKPGESPRGNAGGVATDCGRRRCTAGGPR